jgi:hypothetical protein
MSQLDALFAELQSTAKYLTPEELAEARKIVALKKATEPQACWAATPGPQLDAVESQADVLLYGGAAGGGKSAAVVGLAMTKHLKSLIIRKQYTDLATLTKMAQTYNGTKKGFKGSSPPRLVAQDGRLVDFGACQRLGDEESWQGQDHDFLGIDEAVQLLERQVRFLIGWVRTTTAGQRTRTVLASNPPLDAEGFWIVRMFAPWLDPMFANPANPGELRWVVTVAEEGNAPGNERFNDVWVEGPGTYVLDGKEYEAESRTYIPAKLDDNPYLANDKKYRAKLQNHIFRDALLDGNFMMARGDHDMQVIPSRWVREAMERWEAEPPPGMLMTALACDVAQGGADDTVIARRYGHWYMPLTRRKGVDTKDGPAVAGLILGEARDGCAIVVDAGGGWGGSAMDHLKDNQLPVYPFNGAESAIGRTADPAKLSFKNKRAEAWWRLREALDPNSHPMGSPVQLPMDIQLMAGLTTPRWKLTPQGIQIESKDEIRKRLGRSPDDADAVVMAWSEGQRAAERTQLVRYDQRSAQPIVNLGHSARKRMYRRQ